MKIKLFIFFILALTNLHAQVNDYLITDNSFRKNYVITDSGLYANKYEVTNVEFREFMADLLRKGKNEEYKLCTIDSNGWASRQAYNQPYVDLYYRHPAYQNYPLVNVSYDAAKLYCNWLTNVYNSNPKRQFKKVIFRLPSKNEWEKAAHGGLKGNIYPWKENYLINTECKFLCNFRKIGDERLTFDTLLKRNVVSDKYKDELGMTGFFSDGADITSSVNAYYPNGFGIYNMAGNVSEMIEEKGIAKGGSWISPGFDVRIQSEELYYKPASHIGFRIFMEVIEQ